MIDNAALLGLGCVGGLVLGLSVGVLLLLYSIDELRQMLLRWLDRR